MRTYPCCAECRGSAPHFICRRRQQCPWCHDDHKAQIESDRTEPAYRDPTARRATSRVYYQQKDKK